jgi:multisubunit Na+/H+ antiporter MnhE subunit
MSPLLIKISKDFATTWTTIDPIGNVAIFAGLTASLTRAERRRTALRASIYAAVILAVVAANAAVAQVFTTPPLKDRPTEVDIAVTLEEITEIDEAANTFGLKGYLHLV